MRVKGWVFISFCYAGAIFLSPAQPLYIASGQFKSYSLAEQSHKGKANKAYCKQLQLYYTVLLTVFQKLLGEMQTNEKYLG